MHKCVLALILTFIIIDEYNYECTVFLNMKLHRTRMINKKQDIARMYLRGICDYVMYLYFRHNSDVRYCACAILHI